MTMPASGAPPDSAAVRSLARRMVSEELVILGVRHHSPACARQVAAVIAARRPATVLVEGPRSFTELTGLLAHPEAAAPLAVYTYAVHGSGNQRRRVSSYYPLADYSPELVAVREAVQRGIEVRFIDLEVAEQASAEDPDEDLLLQDERTLQHSRSLAVLAGRLGCRDTEDLWELLMEADDPGLDDHIARLTAYCLLARHDQDPKRLAADGTAAREAEMTWHIRRALAERDPAQGPVLVVVGGFHAVVLPDLLARPPKRPVFRLGRGEQGSALIRYSFERLDRRNGYASGMRSPGWYQRLWTGRRHGSGEAARRSATQAVILDVAGTLRRRHAAGVPTPSLVAAAEQAERLAALRGHPAPLRSDVAEAITSVLVKGDADTEGALVRAVVERVLTGTTVGRVPPGAGTPPLVADALQRLAKARFATDDTLTRTTNLDLYRSADHRRASRLLHGLVLLGVPFATRVAGPDFVSGTGVSRLQERWEYAWTPQVEGALVEAAVLGATLAEAIATRFDQTMTAFAASGDHRHARAAVAMVARACLVGLHQHAAAALTISRDALTADADFVSVAAAAGQLALLWEGREPLEARQLTDLPALLRQAYQRAVFLGRDLPAGHPDPDRLVDGLVRLRELLVGDAGAELDAEPFWSMLHDLAAGHDTALVRGAATGLAHAAGRVGAADLARAVAGHLGGTLAAADAVAFTRGLLLTARETLWHDEAVIRGIDERLAAWDRHTFLTHLPELRLAFAGLTPIETDRLAGRVAGMLGIGRLGPLVSNDVDAETVRRRLLVSSQVAMVIAAEGLGEWVAAE